MLPAPTGPCRSNTRQNFGSQHFLTYRRSSAEAQERLSQSITFDPIPAICLQGSPFALHAVASPSQLPVYFTLVSGPVTLAGNLITPAFAGSVTVRASQPGDSLYQPAPDVVQSFVVLGTNFVLLPERPTSADIASIAFGNGCFIAPLKTGQVLRSANGLNWQVNNSLPYYNWVDITFADGQFVLCASESGARVYTSADGVVWNNVYNLLNFSLPGVYTWDYSYHPYAVAA
ncbi:MAG: hypothetical protein NT154_15620, partial [Verrucomicrobia bacterium]|nr:hypothetical protein [Verrucomicrobiota bacterium]